MITAITIVMTIMEASKHQSSIIIIIETAVMSAYLTTPHLPSTSLLMTILTTLTTITSILTSTASSILLAVQRKNIIKIVNHTLERGLPT